MSRFQLSSAPRERLAAAARLPRRIMAPAFAGASATLSGTAVTDRSGAPSAAVTAAPAPAPAAPAAPAPTASLAIQDTAHRGDI